MFERKDIDPNFDGNEANKIISDSVEAAYLDLSFDELVHIDKACERLNNYAREKGKSIAKRAALELLAAIGDYLNGLEDNVKI
jgi:hypothetical protein